MNSCGSQIVRILAFTAFAWCHLCSQTQDTNWTTLSTIQLQSLYVCDREVYVREPRGPFYLGNSTIGLSWQSRGFLAHAYVGIQSREILVKDFGLMYNWATGYVKIGNYKPPLWPENAREDRDLLLIERSRASIFLDILHATTYHPSVEAGFTFRRLNATLNLAVSRKYDRGNSNSERSFANSKRTPNVVTVRLDANVARPVKVGASFSNNTVGTDLDGINHQGIVRILAPSIQLTLINGLNAFEAESAYAWGRISGRAYLEYFGIENKNISFFEGSLRWKHRELPISMLSYSGYEIATGVSIVSPDLTGYTDFWVAEDDGTFDRITTIRIGLGLYFGKNLRLQVNGERELFKNDPYPTGAVQYRLRSQLSFNF